MTTLLGIGGLSGSGKTTLAIKLKDSLLNISPSLKVTNFSLDQFYKGGDHLANYDHPESIDMELVKKTLEKLRKKEPVNLPNYCFETHTKLKTVTLLEPADIVIVDSIFCFLPEVRRLFDTTIFIEQSKEVCLERRLKRDIAERGRNFTSVVEQFESQVYPMYLEHSHIYKSSADIHYDGNNQMSDILKLLKRRSGHCQLQ